MLQQNKGKESRMSETGLKEENQIKHMSKGLKHEQRRFASCLMDKEGNRDKKSKHPRQSTREE